MKRIGYIFEKIVSIDNLRAAHFQAKSSHKPNRRRRADKYERNLEFNLIRLHDDLINERWEMHPYRAMIRYERGKRREIYYSPNHEDSIVQLAILRVVAPLMKARYIRDTYASIVGRGTSDGVNRIKKFLCSIPKSEKVYILKGDVKQCYASFQHEALMSDILLFFKDMRAARLMFRCFCSHFKGLPIGNPISPLFANLHFTKLDHLAKEVYRFRGYFRYLDDIVVVEYGENAKRRLSNFVSVIVSYLSKRGLKLKENIQVFPITRPGGLDFLGLRFENGVILRKRTERRFRKAVRRFQKNSSAHNLASLSSYWGVILRISRPYRFWHTFFNNHIKQMEALT